MRLTKHHGLGNDFLVVLDTDASHPIDADLARALCDRHTGVGADGLLRASPVAADSTALARMELRNADGSPAEMSGNGIRCLAQALVLGGWPGVETDTAGAGATLGAEIPIDTDAGLRTVTVHERDAATLSLSVAMGPAQVIGDAPEWTGGAVARALVVDMGNPHLVLDLTGAPADASDEVDLVAGSWPGAPFEITGEDDDGLAPVPHVQNLEAHLLVRQLPGGHDIKEPLARQRAATADERPALLGEAADALRGVGDDGVRPVVEQLLHHAVKVGAHGPILLAAPPPVLNKPEFRRDKAMAGHGTELLPARVRGEGQAAAVNHDIRRDRSGNRAGGCRGRRRPAGRRVPGLTTPPTTQWPAAPCALRGGRPSVSRRGSHATPATRVRLKCGEMVLPGPFLHTQAARPVHEWLVGRLC